MANLVDWILEEADGEEIESAVIGKMGWGDYKSKSVPNYERIPKGKALKWNKAKKYLNYEFDSGYGAPGCNAVYAWTKSKVISVCQYDGATCAFSIPRNPTDIMPEMVGG